LLQTKRDESRQQLTIPIMKNNFEKANKVVDSKSLLPITEGIKLDKNFAEVTNLETYYKFKHTLDVRGQGVVYTFKEFYNILKKNKFENVVVDFETEKDRVIVTTPSLTIKLQAFSYDEFPIVPKAKDIFTVSESFVFGEDFKRATTFVGKDELRPVMTGVSIDTKFIAATDAHKLFFKGHGQEVTHPIVLPSGSFFLDGTFKIEGFVTEEPTIKKWDPIWVTLSGEQGVFTIRLIDGKYPDWPNVIPQDNENKISYNRKQLLDATKEVIDLWKETNKSRKPHWRVAPFYLTTTSVKSENIELNREVLVAIEGTVLDGEAKTFKCCAIKLNSILKALDGDNLIFEIADRESRSAVIDSCCLLFPVQ
jgi:DNA polymerase III sliding clamp (beta) subunit (PCNA family)